LPAQSFGTSKIPPSVHENFPGLVLRKAVYSWTTRVRPVAMVRQPMYVGALMTERCALSGEHVAVRLAPSLHDL